MPDGTAHRYIDQMGFLYRKGHENKMQILVKNGELVSHDLPESISFRLSRADIDNPFECAIVDAEAGDIYHYKSVDDVTDEAFDELPQVQSVESVPEQPVLQQAVPTQTPVLKKTVPVKQSTARKPLVKRKL